MDRLNFQIGDRFDVFIRSVGKLLVEIVTTR
jgi:hypothetical protein